MSSILKVQKIQYTDGDDALTIGDSGIIQAHNTLNVSTSSNSTNTATFVNNSYTNSSNGVVHVKPVSYTHLTLPTMS